MQHTPPSGISLIRKLKLNQLMIFERALETCFVAPPLQHNIGSRKKKARAAAQNTASNASQDPTKAGLSGRK